MKSTLGVQEILRAPLREALESYPELTDDLGVVERAIAACVWGVCDPAEVELVCVLGLADLVDQRRAARLGLN